MHVPFNIPAYTGREKDYIDQCLGGIRLSGDGKFSRLCQQWFADKLDCPLTLLTPSCTHALEMAAMLLELESGDEVIMPSYTFPSTANAFVLHGARVRFVDIRPDTMNMDEVLIEQAINEKTRAIVPVHYAGVACEMDAIMALAEKHGLVVIEDAAQGMMSTYHDRPLGALGHLAAYSFHETKNYTSGGEGGLLIINDDRFAERAEIIREKGTNRAKFFRGMVDKYSWVDIGSSFLLNDLSAAYLWGQLEMAEVINDDRLASWQRYHSALLPLADAGLITLPVIPSHCTHNAHMFYLKVRDLEERTALLNQMKAQDILALFHYVPLHSAPAGQQYGTFSGPDVHTTRESERLVRLPMYFGLDERALAQVVSVLEEFFADRR